MPKAALHWRERGLGVNRRHILVALAVATLSTPLAAIRLPEPAPRAHWECVPFARAVSGIQIYGDAHTWWKQAQGVYRRGNAPKIGAVLAFQPHGRMELGHVATVSDIVDARTVRVTHANWSTINGRRGQVERNVEIVDVSPAGDWTKVRVWFAPSQALGTTAYPTHGFIYPAGVTPPAATKAAKPQLAYANVSGWNRPGSPTLANDPKPTGRIAYLGKVLTSGK
jgi:surface antigen